MEKYTILAPAAATAPRKNDPTATPAPAQDVTQAEAVVQEHHRTPETPEARRERIHWELDATLQLLAERAHYITGATGAAIALVDGDAMLCRASIGETAPPVGARLQLDSGVSGEAVRTRAVIRCDEASSDARVNRETCQALGIESILVMPLIRKEEVIGIFELFSSKAHAFSERDVVTLQRMDEMLGTAMMQADAAEGRIESDKETVQAEAAGSDPHVVAEPAPAGEKPAQASVESVVASSSEKAANADSASGESLATMSTQVHDGTTATIHRCTVCGFPVSGGRTLCLDCSKKVTSPASGSDQTGSALPAFLSDPAEEQLEAEVAGIGSWLGKHKYLFGTLFLAVLVIVALLWIR